VEKLSAVLCAQSKRHRHGGRKPQSIKLIPIEKPNENFMITSPALSDAPLQSGFALVWVVILAPTSKARRHESARQMRFR
jgi:hypothetical protein